MHLERIDPLDLDLTTADALAAVEHAAHDVDATGLTAPVGPALLKLLQSGSDGRPCDGLWVARDTESGVVGHCAVRLPVRDNRDSAHVRGFVHPSWRRRGVGGDLLGHALELAASRGRTRVYAGATPGSAGERALLALGFRSDGLTRSAIRRIDLHARPAGEWTRLYDDVAGHAEDYELVRVLGPTPPDLLEPMVELHAAINDAPPDDPEAEDDHWDAERVRAYDTAMAARRQTVHRVLARHTATGRWAGLSILCIDEFHPAVAHQEDTSVLPMHRGHRLGLLMKLEMLRWVAETRPEVAATDTWNATTNHHMIAVNERLGGQVVAHHQTYRRAAAVEEA